MGKVEFFEEYHSRKEDDSWSIFSDPIRKRKFAVRLNIIKRWEKLLSSDLWLDVGAGEGQVTQYFKHKVIATDISFAALKHAINFGRISDAFVADIEALPIKNCTLGTVFFIGTLCYLPGAQKALLEVSRVLANKGYLVLTTQNKLDIGSLLMSLLKKDTGYIFTQKGSRWSEQRHSIFYIRKCLSNMGLKIICYEGVVFGVQKLLRKYPRLFSLAYLLGRVLKIFANQQVILAKKK